MNRTLVKHVWKHKRNGIRDGHENLKVTFFVSGSDRRDTLVYSFIAKRYNFGEADVDGFYNAYPDSIKDHAANLEIP